MRLTVSVLSLLAASAVQAQTPPPAAASAPAYDSAANYTKYEYKVPVRDGKKLFTVVYVPKEAARDAAKTYPFLMVRTPYSCGPYGVDNMGVRRLAPSEDFLKAGYIFVCQDVRGRYMSEGHFVEMTPHVANKKSKNDVDESSDTHDSVQWLLDHVKGHNGKLGLWGISYPGFYVAASIIDSHPAIKAASPQAPIADYFMRDDGYHGGGLMLVHNYGFFTSYKVQDNPTIGPKGSLPFDYNSRDGYDYFLKLGNLANIQKSFGPKGERNPYFDQLVDNDTYNEHWKARAIPPHLKGIKAAVLTVGGWYDAEDLAGPLSVYKHIKAQNPGSSNQLVMGPWVHGGWSRSVGKALGQISFAQNNSEFFQKKIVFPFFEQHLRGAADAKLPEAYMFETGTNVWRQYDAWPPAQAKARTLYFQPGGKLGFTPPAAAQSAFDQYISDPNKPVPFVGYTALSMPQEYMVSDQRFAATRPDVLVYESEVLEEDVTVAGPVGAKLFVSTSGTDSDWVVKLIDVHPPEAGEPPGARSRDGAPSDPETPKSNFGGFQQLVRGDPLRGRFRNSFEKPEAMVPGKVEQIAFDLPDVNHTFRRGHKIMVQVQSSWFPLIDRNPQSFVRIRDAKPEDFKAATQKVYRWKDQASGLVLRVID
ncbi:CocE/NonD family hydrolase [Pelomonas sp. SE-A7]|uniref:CocE/NonD family hydrolase n=1 Tax=Pelomonas sp. SE-A7 TaxID=3054953 RepID=UPI00259D29DC|nr:CocE/NonD family hydrolase [Pelomonas sp. SE-A7]MDM4767219.1 CocE/NonD family hydrolase [Pelomonas sp. SE-A7]